MIVVPTLECGGLERNVSMICNHINTTIFDVSLAVINNANPFYTITNPDISVYDLQYKNVRKSIFRIRSLVKEIKPVIILSTANHLNLLFAIFKWIFPKSTRIIARESSVVSVNSKRARQPVLYNNLLVKFYNRLDLIICQSRFMQEDLIKNYQVSLDRTCIINNAVELPVANISAEGNKTGVKKFITVARLSEEKGIDRILRAVAQLDFPFKYTIIGEGGMRPSLEKLIPALGLDEKVSIPGRSDQPFAEMKDPDLFLMGSHYEGFPNVLLEANALGIPVIAFNAPGGIGEVLMNYKNGILVDGDNEVEFAKTIQKALFYDFDRKMISSYTMQRYDVKKIMGQWEELFVNILKKGRTVPASI